MHYGGHKRSYGNGDDEHHGERFKRQRIAPPRDLDADMESEDPTLETGSTAARGEYRPAMLSFKAFLSTQDDFITDEESLVKFSEYKKEFNRQQMNEFFVAHKEEEWMRDRYHPDQLEISTDTAKKAIQRRLEVYMDLYNEGIIDKTSLQADNAQQIELLLDSFVAHLEDPDREGLLLEPDDPKRDILCKTRSLYLSTVHPEIKNEELLGVLKKYPGYLRMCLSDPSPETRWKRRGWATFTREAKIKEICFNLSNIRLKESELSPVLNKDLSRRIRSVQAVCNDKAVLRSCLQVANQLVNKLDTKWGLWDVKPNELLGGTIESGNPLLVNIAEYLVEEMSAEEDELLGCADQSSGARSPEYDSELALVLDRLVLYLRLVHSLDLYNYAHYITEEEMPNRCGLFHVRDALSADTTISEQDIQDFKETFSKKIKAIVDGWVEMPEHEMLELGPKSEEDAIDMYIQTNVEELGNNKNLCTLCGKKFKGSDFVKKHILNKHEEGIQAVKKEVVFYNNYIKDRKRPALPERPKSPAKPAPPRHVARPAEPRSVFSRIKENIPDRQDKGSIKDRLGYKKANFAVTSAAKDPRSVVDYSDVEFSEIFD
jgi:hypothetical protein